MRPGSLLFSAPLLLASVQAMASQPTVVAVRVPATSNPYLAGLIAGTSSYRDRAPEQSPVLTELFLGGATYVTFAATGGVQHHPFRPPLFDPPNGSTLVKHSSEHGISEASLPIDCLLGVFLGDDLPDSSPAPPPISYHSTGWNFVSLEPQLKQIFFIGKGEVTRRADSGKKEVVARQFLVPKGATRLYLGVMDEYEWNNNEGYFDVVVTLERVGSSSTMFNVDSSINFEKWACSPNRSLCTPEKGLVEAAGPDQYHVVLPAQLEWGASIPNPRGRDLSITGASGTVCLDGESRRMSMCNGPAGNSKRAGSEFPLPHAAVGALIVKTAGGRTYFSVNDRSRAFENHQGYFEFDVTLK